MGVLLGIAYVDCFHTDADHNAVGEWILKHELASTQQQKETPVLSSIRTAAKFALEGCVGLIGSPLKKRSQIHK